MQIAEIYYFIQKHICYLWLQLVRSVHLLDKAPAVKLFSMVLILLCKDFLLVYPSSKLMLHVVRRIKK